MLAQLALLWLSLLHQIVCSYLFVTSTCTSAFLSQQCRQFQSCFQHQRCPSAAFRCPNACRVMQTVIYLKEPSAFPSNHLSALQFLQWRFQTHPAQVPGQPGLSSQHHPESCSLHSPGSCVGAGFAGSGPGAAMGESCPGGSSPQGGRGGAAEQCCCCLLCSAQGSRSQPVILVTRADCIKSTPSSCSWPHPGKSPS